MLLDFTILIFSLKFLWKVVFFQSKSNNLFPSSSAQIIFTETCRTFPRLGREKNCLCTVSCLFLCEVIFCLYIFAGLQRNHQISQKNSQLKQPVTIWWIWQSFTGISGWIRFWERFWHRFLWACTCCKMFETAIINLSSFVWILSFCLPKLQYHLKRRSSKVRW